MGQEIEHSGFNEADRQRFTERQTAETAQLADWLEKGVLMGGGHVAGLELEACLVDPSMRPAPCNDAFLARFESNEVTAELARFNIEVNSPPQPIGGDFLHTMHEALEATWQRCHATAAALDSRVVMTGILPTLQPDDLTLSQMSSMVRYRALNEQVLAARQGRPLRLEIVGREHLQHEHPDVMLESAATSFQLHLQVAPREAVRFYNASVIASAPLVAACANSPYLFGHDLWDESRIPLFEQAVEAGGFDGAAFGPVRRVTFGSGYVRESLLELFTENRDHYPVLLPVTLDEPAERLPHLTLHNGTVWRWNRPLVGFDHAGQPHLRIEHRPLPAGPTVADCMANAALYYGLVHALAESNQPPEECLPFAAARDNFYQAARHGLDATLIWLEGEPLPVQRLLLDRLLPLARHALLAHECDATTVDHYLGLIEQRVATGRTGAAWQRDFIARHPGDFAALTRAMEAGARCGEPVHNW